MGETSDVALYCRTPRSGGLIEKPMGTMPEPCRPIADASIRANVPHTIGFDGNHRLLMPRLRQLLAGLGQPRIKYARLQRNYPADRHAGCCRMPNGREGRRRGVSPARTAMRTGRSRPRARPGEGDIFTCAMSLTVPDTGAITIRFGGGSICYMLTSSVGNHTLHNERLEACWGHVPILAD